MPRSGCMNATFNDLDVIRPCRKHYFLSVAFYYSAWQVRIVLSLLHEI